MTWVIQMGSGEMMRAMGDIMVKHGQKLAGATKCLRKTRRAEAPPKPQRKARIPMQTFLRSLAIAVALAAGTAFALPHHAAASAAELKRDSQAALNQLYATNPGAKELGKKTVAILVFPAVVKAGLGVGGQFGEGVLYRGGKATAYYNNAGGSIGLQAGAQKYSYALFFLSEETLKYLDKSEGFEIGIGPSVVIADDGFAKSMTTTTSKDQIYAFIFDQKGAMAALGIQGNKITKIQK
jgi:lipid-binding SYLF domain-containing protein